MFKHQLAGQVGFFVALLVLGNACGDGEISDASGGARLGPEAGDPQLGPEAGDPQETPPPPPPTGTPYGHVVPSDVGKTIGVGVVGPVPTTVYTGPNPITVPGTVVENRVINEELRIEADNVVVRNCIINNSNGAYAINVDEGDNVLIEYNKINKGVDGKQFRISSPGAGALNTTVRRNEATGGVDFMWINETEGLLVEDNYIHSMHASGDAHHDAFQTSGGSISTDPNITITIRGNYIHLNAQGPTPWENAVVFIDNGNTLVFESNYIAERWGGLAPLRMWQDYPAPTVVRYNVYGNSFRSEFAAGMKAVHYQDDLTATRATYACNRYADGSFIEQQWVGHETTPVTHDTTDCPSYP